MQKTTIALVFGLAGLAAGSLLSNVSSAASTWFHVGNDNAQRANTIGGFGHYEDEMVKVNGQWFFTKRTIFNEGSAHWQYKGDRNPAW
jgi:hypothetical protein